MKLNISVISVLFFTFIVSSCNLLNENDDPSPSYDVSIYPPGYTTLSEYQIISFVYDLEEPMEIEDILVYSDGVEASLINDTNPLLERRGRYDIVLCTDCLPGNSAIVKYIFKEAQIPDMIINYNINHSPVVNVQVEKEGDMLFLDAGSSIDPEGRLLEFTWQFNDTVFEGPVFSATSGQINDDPPLLTVNDGSVSVRGLVVVFTDNGDYAKFLNGNSCKCTNLTVASSGKSLTNPEITLGPNQKENEIIELDADKKLKRDYYLGYTFEVRSKLVIDTNYNSIDEGQDVASTDYLMFKGEFKKMDWKGKRRHETNRSTYLPGTFTAPFPDLSQPHPANGYPTVTDNYDFHPEFGYTYIPDNNGIKYVNINKKKLIKVGKDYYIVWLDIPGARLKKGWDMSKGYKMSCYFRSWMEPDLSQCQKFFIVEMDIDSNGKVLKNKLTMIP